MSNTLKCSAQLGMQRNHQESGPGSSKWEQGDGGIVRQPWSIHCATRHPVPAGRQAGHGHGTVIQQTPDAYDPLLHLMQQHRGCGPVIFARQAEEGGHSLLGPLALANLCLRRRPVSPASSIPYNNARWTD